MSQIMESFGSFRFDEIFTQIPSALLLTDADGVLQTLNDKAVAILGDGFEEGKNLYDLMTNELERKRVQKQAKEALQGHPTSPRFRITMGCTDGTEHFFSMGVYALKKPELPMALLWQLDPAVSQSNLQELFDKIADGLTIFDITGRCYEVNEAYAHMMGYTKEELLSPDFDWVRLTPPELLERDRQFIQRALKDETVHYEKEYIHKDGHRIPVMSSISKLEPQDDVDQDLLIATVRSIDATPAEEALHAAMDASSNVLMLASPSLTITHVNQACRDFFARHEKQLARSFAGFSADKLVGSSIDAFHKKPAHARRILQRLAEAAKPGQDAHHSRIEVAGCDFSQMIRPVVIAGQFMGYSVEWRDVGALQAMEARWQALLDGSEQGIAVLNAAGAILETNMAARELLGEQVDWQVVLGEAGLLFHKTLQKAMATGHEHFETWGSAPDGHRIYLRCYLRRLPMGSDVLDAHFVMTITDLTDLKTNEAALAQQEAYWRSIIDATGTGLVVSWEQDGEQRVEMVNQAFCDLLGYSQEEFREPGIFLRATPKDFVAKELEMIRDASNHGRLIQYEKPLIHRDGHLVHVLITIHPLARAGYVCASFSDLTMLKEKERQLDQAAPRYQKELFESITEGLAVFDSDRLYMCNEVYAHSLGYTKEELLDPAFAWNERIIPHERLDETMHLVKSALEGKVVRTEFELLRKDGHRLPVTISFRKLKRQPQWEQDRLIITVSDLSELKTIKKKEAELADASRYRQELFESLTEGLVVFSLDGKLHEVNTAMTVMTGHTMAEAMSPDFGWDRVIPPEQMGQAVTLIMAALEDKAVRTEFEFMCKDGRRFPVMVSFCKLNRHPDWDQDRLVAIISDISMLKRQELELRRIQAALDTVSTNVVVADAAGIIIHENPANKHFWKEREAQIRTALPRFSAESMLGSNIDFFHRKPEHQRAIMAKMAESGLDVRITIQLAGFELDAVVHPIFDGAGLLQGYVAEFVDVTAQREKEAQIQAFMDAAFEGMTVFDADGRLYLANQRCADLLGLGLDTIMAPTFDCRREILRMTPEESQAIMASLQLEEGRVATMEWEIIRRDGSKLPVLLGITKLPWRGTWDKDHYIATIFDLSETRAREHALKQASGYRQELFESLTEGLIVFSLDGKLHEVNNAFAVMMGYSPEEVRSPDFNWSRIVAPEKMDQAMALITEALQGRSMRVEFEFVGKDGRRIPILISYRKLNRHADWDQDRLVAIVSDFTQLKTAITHLQQAAAHIRGGLSDLTEGNRNLDQRNQQQAAGTEEVSTAIEELSSAIARNAEHAVTTTARADEVRGHAEAGSKLIYAAEEKMAAIARASEAITEIAEAVDSFAFSTNLLALNAAVEAARAGEHGRGFAVVATEVRRLAQSSAENAKSIKKLIARSTTLITEGSTLSSQGVQSFNAILQGIQEVSKRIAEIAQVTSSQSHASAQLTDAITAISRTTQENSALVEENSAACATLADQAEQLEELAGMFRVV